MGKKQLGRRDFFCNAASVAAGFSIPLFIPSGVLAQPGKPGANERVNIGMIGLGGRAYQMLDACAEVPQVRIVSICDCYPPRCTDFLKNAGQNQNWSSYEDFRQMIARERLDAVMVETPTHARAWIVIQAMLAGLDVYIEKPIALTVAEGRAIVRAAQRLQRVTQVGTQQRSMPINNWASDLVKHGALGKVHTVIAPNYVGPIRWEKTSTKDVRGTVDPWWDAWTNQTELRPYDPQLHRSWGKWWDYDGGGGHFGVTGWGAHSFDQINRALGTDCTGPVEVLLEEPVAMQQTGKYEPRRAVGGVVQGETGSADTGAAYHAYAKLSGPRARVSMKFANGTNLKAHLEGDRGPGLGAIFIGEKGKLEINRNKLASNPRELVQVPENPGPNKRNENAYHVENWAECIKSRRSCNADIEIGQRASTLCCLVNIARQLGRVGETLHWDPVAERFTNCDEANELLWRPRRRGYELPELG